MHDGRVLELIHAELDGELDADGRAELERALLASPEARAVRDDLRRVTQALERLAPVEAPADLRAAVVAAVRPSNGRVIEFRQARRAAIGGRRAALHYGLALAAGVVVGVIGLALLQTPDHEFDASQLAGTMGRHAPLPPGSALASVAVQTPEIRGSVALHQSQGLWVLEFDLASEAPVAVSASYDARAIRLNGLAQADAGVVSLAAAPGQVGFVNQGSQRFAVFLQPLVGEQGSIQLSFEAAGRVLHAATLQVPVPAQAE